MTFDANKELKQLRDSAATKRRARYHQSQLTKYRSQLVALKLAGASLSEIAEWHRKQARKSRALAKSTIQRFLTKLPELSNTHDL